MVQLHNFFWQGSKVVPVISSILEKPKCIAALRFKENAPLEGGLNPGIEIIPNLSFFMRNFYSKSHFFFMRNLPTLEVKTRAQERNFLTTLDGQKLPRPGLGRVLPSPRTPWASLQPETLSEQQIHLKFHLLWPPTPPLEVQFFRYCSSQGTEWDSVISHLTAPERKDKHRKSCDKTELH